MQHLCIVGHMSVIYSFFPLLLSPTFNSLGGDDGERAAVHPNPGSFCQLGTLLIGRREGLGVERYRGIETAGVWLSPSTAHLYASVCACVCARARETAAADVY